MKKIRALCLIPLVLMRLFGRWSYCLKSLQLHASEKLHLPEGRTWPSCSYGIVPVAGNKAVNPQVLIVTFLYRTQMKQIKTSGRKICEIKMNFSFLCSSEKAMCPSHKMPCPEHFSNNCRLLLTKRKSCRIGIHIHISYLSSYPQKKLVLCITTQSRGTIWNSGPTGPRPDDRQQWGTVLACSRLGESKREISTDTGGGTLLKTAAY